MTTIMPTDKNLRHAIAWIEEQRTSKANLTQLMDQAAMRYNLTPLEQAALARFYEDEDQAR